MPGYLDVRTDAVAAAGSATEATSADWERYADTVRSALADAAGLVHSGVVAGAVTEYASMWHPRIVAVADIVAALGQDTRTAANTVTDADARATSQLRAAASAHETTGGRLSRGING